MRRFWCALPLLVILLPACRIEQTPAEYIDVLEVPQDDINASQEELTDRLQSTASALERRNLTDLLTALTPASEIVGYGPSADQPVTDATSLAYTLTQPTGGRTVTISDLEVQVGPRNNVAWFRTAYRLEGQDDGPSELRFSGVFLREEGGWLLVQAHVSTPVSPASPPLQAEDDTPAAGG